MQRHLLHDDLVDGNDNYNRWTSTYVVVDYIDLTIKKRTLRIWYENKDEEDVYKGAIDRPKRWKRIRKKTSCTIDKRASTAGSLTQHVRQNQFAPPPFDSHSSSIDDLSSNGTSVYVQQSSKSRDEDKGVNFDETISNAIPAHCWPRQLRMLQTHMAPAPSDSKSTE